jgi:hypothetical protein
MQSYPFQFIRYTDTVESSISVLIQERYHYHGSIRDDISDDLIHVINRCITGDREIVEKRVYDFLNTVLQYQNGEYIHIQLYIECNNIPSYTWHYDYGYGKKYVAAIAGSTTVFLVPNEYNMDIMYRHDNSDEPIDLVDALKDEKMISSCSNQISIFDASVQEAIHLSPLRCNDRIFISLEYGSYIQVYTDAINENEEYNWMKFHSER